MKQIDMLSSPFANHNNGENSTTHREKEGSLSSLKKKNQN
jgi:hypothetical protein